MEHIWEDDGYKYTKTCNVLRNYKITIIWNELIVSLYAWFWYDKTKSMVVRHRAFLLVTYWFSMNIFVYIDLLWIVFKSRLKALGVWCIGSSFQKGQCISNIFFIVIKFINIKLLGFQRCKFARAQPVKNKTKVSCIHCTFCCKYILSFFKRFVVSMRFLFIWMRPSTTT